MCPAAAKTDPCGIWQEIVWTNWDPDRYSEMAFAITSWRPPFEPVKWTQPPVPDPCRTEDDYYLGWDERSIITPTPAEPGLPETPSPWPMVADDFYCLGPKPVSAIHWWGSFNEYADTLIPSADLPKGFQIAFWTDAPAYSHPDPDIYFSYPLRMIHEIYCTNFEVDFYGWDVNPWTQTVEAKFQFTQYLNPEEWFHQGLHDRIYWVSIAADYGDCLCNGDLNNDGVINTSDFSVFTSCYNMGPPITPGCEQADFNCDGLINVSDMAIFVCQYNVGWPDPTCCEDNVFELPPHPWGWETRPHFFQDDAVRIRPGQGETPHLGYVTRPGTGTGLDTDIVEPIEGIEGKSWDLAFELGTDPNYIKWAQPFDPDWPLNEDKVSMARSSAAADEVLFESLVVDDWPCRNPWPVTSVEWWGSYLGYDANAGIAVPTRPDYFLLTIWTDRPANTPPIDPCYAYSTPEKAIWSFKADDYVEVLAGKEMSGEIVYKYYVNLPPQEYFCQDPNEENIYWLSIVAVYPQGLQLPYDWGWTNHEHVFEDDAVTGDPLGGPWPVDDPWNWLFYWTELFDANGVSADQSFVLETDPTKACWCYYCHPCGDFNNDLKVSPADALGLLDAWPPKSYHPCADFDHNGVIAPADALRLLDHWPPKPMCPAGDGCAPPAAGP